MVRARPPRTLAILPSVLLLLVAPLGCSDGEILGDKSSASAGGAGHGTTVLPDGAIVEIDGGGHGGHTGAADGGEVVETAPPTGDPWSDPKSWPSGSVPKAGDDVVIAKGKQILLDVSPPALGELTVDGTLVFAEQDLELSAARILVNGKLQVGANGRLFKNRATITLTAQDREEDKATTGTRGIIVVGQLELHGAAPTPTWTKLGESANAGVSTLSLLDDTDWQSGDELIVASTDYYRIGADEIVDVASASGNSITLDGALAADHWGVLQYVDDSGVTLTETTSVTSRVLDERAEVGNLSRTITIQGADDDNWQSFRFGAHVMVHHHGVAHIEGVRFERMGQAGITGRYPVHFHLLSYDLDGSELGDATGQYLRDSTIVHSAQRCVVVHGTNGLTLSGNICHDIRGHAFFLEDAVERRNVLENNLVVGVHAPLPSDLLMNHERKDFRRGPAGFWLTNPDNTVRGNVVSGSEGIGFWLSFPENALNVLKAVNIHPRFMRFGMFDDNTAHSNGVSGMMFDIVPINDAGDTLDLHYIPYKDGVNTNAVGDQIPFTLNRFTSYKHETGDGGDGVFWNRARNATFDGFVLADFDGVGFKGGSQACLITGALVVGTSLNDENKARDTQPTEGAASYHSECRIEKNVFVNLPGTPNQRGGAFSTEDYYLRGVDKGLIFNPDNTFINTHPGYRVPSPNIANTGGYALAGALWDPQGYWGPKNYYWVYDLPFLTAGTNCVFVTRKLHDNDKVCEGPYYDIGVPRRDHEDVYSEAHMFRALRFERQDNGTVWEIPQGVPPGLLLQMRHAALVKDGEYIVRTPGTSPGHSVEVPVTNVHSATDGFVLGFEYDGTKTPVGYATSWPDPRAVTTWTTYGKWKSNDASYSSEMRAEYWRPLTSVPDKAAVLAGNGDSYFQDTANNLIWLKVRRLSMAEPAYAPGTGEELYARIFYVFDDQI